MSLTEKEQISAHERERRELPPLEPRLWKAYLVQLEGIFHTTSLNQITEKLIIEENQSATEVARASVVQGGACLDTSIKQMVRDSLLYVAELDRAVRKKLATMVNKTKFPLSI